MKKLFEALEKQLSFGKDMVMATIVAASGSTPRGAGSRMIVGSQGRIAGTIGGGAVEYRSIQTAMQILKDKRSCEHSFQLNQDDISNLGMVCGGDVTVFFHYLSHEDQTLLSLLQKTSLLFEKRADFWLITDLTNQGQLHLYAKGKDFVDPTSVPEEILSSCTAKPHRMQTDSLDYFIEQIGFSETVYIFGGGHVSQSLVPALAAADFQCVVLDDRPEFVARELFPGVAETILCDFNQFDQFITITEHDLCCVMTRGHSYDTNVQAQLLKTPAYYIGVIGSRRKKAAVFQRLTEEFGIPEAELARIITPIGLSIKAETPAEIAVSITAQMILARAEHRLS